MQPILYHPPTSSSSASSSPPSSSRSASSSSSPAMQKQLSTSRHCPVSPSFPFVRLPPEVAASVATLLPAVHLRQLRLASRALEAVACPVLWAAPVLPAHSPLPLEPFLLTHGRYIRHLYFPDPSRVDLVAVAPSLPNLVSVDLSGLAAYSVCDIHVVALLAACRKLESIVLDDCVDITDDSMVALAAYPNASFVKTLRVDRCSYLTDKGLCIAIPKLPRLKRLSANTLPFATAAFVQAIATHCTMLEQLGVSDGDALTDDSLTWLARGCPLLENIDFSECPNVTEAGLVEFARIRRSDRDDFVRGASSPPLPRIRRFSQAWCEADEGDSRPILSASLSAMDAVTDRSLSALLLDPNRQRNRCSSSQHADGAKVFSRCGLRMLGISRNSECTTRFLSSVARDCARDLAHLDISFVTFAAVADRSESTPAAVLAAAVKQLTHLKVLNMSCVRAQNAHGAGGAPVEGSVSDTVVSDLVCAAIAEGPSASLLVLDVSDNPQVTDEGLRAVARCCTNLVDLNLKGCSRLTDVSVQMLAGDDTCGERTSGCTKLKYLNLGLCSGVTDVSVVRLASLTTTSTDCASERTVDSWRDRMNRVEKDGGADTLGLHSIKLSGCFNITDVSVDAFAARSRKVECASTFSTFSDAQASTPPPIERGDNRISSVRLLCFSGCYRLSGGSLASLFPNTPFLESINLYSCFYFNDSALCTLVTHCPRLQSLVISKCPVSDVGVSALAAGCKRLHTLYVSFLSPIVTPTVHDDMDVANDLKSDEYEALQQQEHRPHPIIPNSSRELTDAGVVSLLLGCPSLKLLDVSRCESLTDRALLTVASAVAADSDASVSTSTRSRSGIGLQVLVARACPRVSFEGLSALARSCPHLQRLDATGCGRVSAEQRAAVESLLNGR